MNWDPRRLRAGTARSRRRRAGVTLAVVVGAVLGMGHAPYATLTPGPTPDLTSAVRAAQGSAHAADPTLGASGRMLATTVDGTQVTWLGFAACALRSCPMLPVDTSSADAQVDVTRQMAASQQAAAAAARALVGATSAYPDAQLSADLGQIGGPSAGLMLTLAFVDALTPGDLTGGAVLAGTGTITPTGQVGLISGIADKVAGARRAGASVFFAPSIQAGAARAAAPASMRVVGVDTAAQALGWLCAHGGTSSACRLLPDAPKPARAPHR